MRVIGDTKHLTEGAILTGIFLVLAFLSYFTPLFLFAFIVLPVPFVVLYARTNWRVLLLSAIAGFIILFSLLDPLISFKMSLLALLVGGALGYAFKKSWPASRLLIAGTIAFLGVFLVKLLFFQVVLGINLLEVIMTGLKEAAEAQAAFLEGMEAPEGQIQDVRDITDLLRENIPVFLPATLLMASTVLGYFQVVINRGILNKLGYKTASFPPFANWRFPQFFAWYYVIATVILLFQPNLSGYIGRVAANLFTVTNYILLLQGITLVYWFLKINRSLHKVFSIFIILVLLAIPPLNMVVILLGLSDQLFNIRKFIESRGG